MPAYNARMHITTAIESVLAQDYPNLKLLILNDGSTDNLQEIMNSDSIASEMRNGRILYDEASPNQGIAKTRRTLLEWSKQVEANAYLLWLDADDKYIEKTFLSDVMRQMQQTRAEICLYNFSIRYEDESQRPNAVGLIKDRENSISVINSILAEPSQAIIPDEFQNLLKFTSLGWTKCYAPTIKIPEPANCPYEDLVYMASLLQAKSITALPAERTPIEYLRRSTSICGQRTHRNFEHDIPIQLKLFFDLVCDDYKKTGRSWNKLTMAQNFVNQKFELYTLTLQNLLAAATPVFPSITRETLTVFQEKKSELNRYIDRKLNTERMTRKKSVINPLLIAAGVTGIFIAYRIYSTRSPIDLSKVNASDIKLSI